MAAMAPTHRHKGGSPARQMDLLGGTNDLKGAHGGGAQTVFLVDDDAAVRTALEALCQSAGLLVETFDSGSAFLSAYSPERSGCLVLDLRMPGLSGADLQEALHHLECDLPTIILSGFGDIPQAVAAMRLGALDFLEKPVRHSLLLERVDEALQLDLARREVRRARALARERLTRLTPREQEVASRLALGQSNKLIAIELGLSERTVEIHRSRVMEKTASRSLAELLQLLQFSPA